MNNLIKIVDDGELKTSELIKKIPHWSYWNEREFDEYFPAPKVPTERYFKAEQESEHKGKSWNEIKSEGLEIMTLREYILFEIAYLNETGKHADEKGWTIFSDTLPGGRVASGGGDPGYGQSGFDWVSAGYCYPDYGARSAINPSSLNLVTLPEILIVNGVTYKKHV